jgi:hypothetical protein
MIFDSRFHKEHASGSLSLGNVTFHECNLEIRNR